MTVPVHQLSDLPRGPVTPGRWTAIIPAAGRGARLGSDEPKILYRILGRPILYWLLDALEPVCDSVVLVLSPEGRPVVEPVLRQRLGTRAQVVIQERPSGTADAVRSAAKATNTDYVLVVWGDHVTLRAETVMACAALHERRPNASLTLATVMKNDPYVDVERDGDGRIVRVRQAREGEVERVVGENDCGLFLFTTKMLCATLDVSLSGERGKRARESNLIQILPAFEFGPGSVATVRLSDPEQTLGINTVEEARTAAKILDRWHSLAASSSS